MACDAREQQIRAAAGKIRPADGTREEGVSREHNLVIRQMEGHTVERVPGNVGE